VTGKIKKLQISRETLRMLTATHRKLPDLGITPSEGGQNNTCVCDTYDASCVMQCVSYGSC
jgi:hypothetical protein